MRDGDAGVAQLLQRALLVAGLTFTAAAASASTTASKPAAFASSAVAFTQ